MRKACRLAASPKPNKHMQGRAARFQPQTRFSHPGLCHNALLHTRIMCDAELSDTAVCARMMFGTQRPQAMGVVGWWLG